MTPSPKITFLRPQTEPFLRSFCGGLLHLPPDRPASAAATVYHRVRRIDAANTRRGTGQNWHHLHHQIGELLPPHPSNIRPPRPRNAFSAITTVDPRPGERCSAAVVSFCQRFYKTKNIFDSAPPAAKKSNSIAWQTLLVVPL